MNEHPVIPPDRAFVVGGTLSFEVRQVLEEARRLRDLWRVRAEDEPRLRRRRLSTLLGAVRRLAEREQTRLREQAIELALVLAERLVREARDDREHPARSMLERWAEHLPTVEFPGEDRVLSVSSDDWVLSVSSAEPLEIEGLPAGLRVVTDPTLSPGDYLLRGPGFSFDGRLRSRLRAYVSGARGQGV
ncbi:MAG: hypothetical protein EXR76_15480 [Myxococcales bacterium]|nr:hypothetical protein [Myxococcales bacterium]